MLFCVVHTEKLPTTVIHDLTESESEFEDGLHDMNESAYLDNSVDRVDDELEEQKMILVRPKRTKYQGV